MEHSPSSHFVDFYNLALLVVDTSMVYSHTTSNQQARSSHSTPQQQQQQQRHIYVLQQHNNDISVLFSPTLNPRFPLSSQ